jgi:hypothetical protein
MLDRIGAGGARHIIGKFKRLFWLKFTPLVPSVIAWPGTNMPTAGSLSAVEPVFRSWKRKLKKREQSLVP